jgi:hypothetical protein
VLQDQDELKCVDPLSGVVLWARNDVPIGCELFGDGELAFAADVANRTAYVIRVKDGQLLGKRDLPRGEWLITTGRNIAQINYTTNHGNRIIAVTITDIWSGKSIYQAELPVTSQVSVVEPNQIAIYEPSGAFHLIDVATGDALLDKQLESANDLQAIQTLRFDDKFYLFVSGPAQPQIRPLGQPTDFPINNGQVYAFDLKTKESLWPGPATVRNRGIIMQQPAGIPLLVFADRQQTRDAMNGGVLQMRLLCLDRRTGETVYRNDALPDISIARFRIRGEVDSRPTVAVEMNGGKIQLTMTERPRPPQPPANEDLEAAREIAARGVRGLGERIGNAVLNVFERPGPVQMMPQRINQVPVPQAQPLPVKPVPPNPVPASKPQPQKVPPAQSQPTPATDDN